MKTILCDMDSVISDFYFEIIKQYRAETGEELADEYISGWNMDFPNGKNIFDYFGKPGFFRGLAPIPGALDTLKSFHDQGHEVVVVSAATLTHAPGEKYEWFSEHAPWLSRDRIIFAKEKFRVHGDFLIDDHSENVGKWLKYWRLGYHHRVFGVGIEYPYNSGDIQKEVFDLLAPSFKDFRGAWQKIESFILSTP